MGAGRHFASVKGGSSQFVCSLQSRRAGFDSFAHSRDNLARSTDRKGTAGSLMKILLRACKVDGTRKWRPLKSMFSFTDPCCRFAILAGYNRSTEAVLGKSARFCF